MNEWIKDLKFLVDIRWFEKRESSLRYFRQMIPKEIQEAIRMAMDNVEKERDVRILLAVESGSRAGADAPGRKGSTIRQHRCADLWIGG